MKLSALSELQPRVCNQINSTDVADGALIDRVRIEFLFDQMEEVLVQPGVNVVQLQRISSPSNLLCQV